MNTTNKTQCPLCGNYNQCALTEEGKTLSDCWCHHTTISAEALSAIAINARNQRCICQRCASTSHLQHWDPKL